MRASDSECGPRLLPQSAVDFAPGKSALQVSGGTLFA